MVPCKGEKALEIREKEEAHNYNQRKKFRRGRYICRWFKVNIKVVQIKTGETADEVVGSGHVLEDSRDPFRIDGGYFTLS